MRNLIYILALLISLCACNYGVNSKTSQIGNLNDKCLNKQAWENLTELYSPENIKDSNFAKRVDDLRNHFTKPKYILYFDESPKEIIACDHYSVRAAYTPAIADQVIDGLSPQLSDNEQIRIRNRVQKALMKYQCPEGKLESIKWMKRPAIFSEEYYKQ